MKDNLVTFYMFLNDTRLPREDTTQWTSSLNYTNQHEGEYWVDARGDHKLTARLKFTGKGTASHLQVTTPEGKKENFNSIL